MWHSTSGTLLEPPKPYAIKDQALYQTNLVEGSEDSFKLGYAKPIQPKLS